MIACPGNRCCHLVLPAIGANTSLLTSNVLSFSTSAARSHAMTTVSTMLPITLPRFASAGAPQSAPQSSAPQWGAAAANNNDGQQGDPLDFDLLAEYLLDDAAAVGTNAAGMPQFDFSEANVGSGVVSPEQSEDGFPPIADSTPRMMHARVAVPRAAPRPVPLAAQVLPMQPLLAPAPPTIASQGMSLPHPGMPMAPAGTFPSLPTPVPLTMAAPPGISQGMVLHQHRQHAPALVNSIPGNKRRRVDMPTQVMAGPPSAQAQLISGHLAAHAAMAGRGRQKSQAQIDRRRERNRILARRTRLRKKFFFESLQKDVTDLQRENIILKELVRKKLDPEVSKELLAGCKAMEQLPSAVHEAVGEGADIDGQDFNLVRSIQRSQQCFIITDPSLQDNPIVYASGDFLTLTGYEREDVLGRNCRFLQGTETSTQKVEQVRKAISTGDDVTVTMINYTADGTAFWNKLFIAALRDAQNNIVNFIGVIVKVANPEPDDPEAGKRLNEGTSGDGNMQTDAQDDDDDAEVAVAEAADGTVRAMEGVVSAAVAAAPIANGAPLS
mmetsp:Transcript_3583/g.6007  ORF Transcript_3583/g.6007 Transcript_3583/m.6007 type:complete len:554 (-) Transcript_3583:168-1829(-)